MRKHIDNLRSQHPAVRTKVAVAAAFSITAIVAVAWLTTLPVRFGDLAQGSSNTAAVIDAAGNAMQPQAQEFQRSLQSFQGLQIAPNPQSNVPSDEPAADEYPPVEYTGY